MWRGLRCPIALQIDAFGLIVVVVGVLTVFAKYRWVVVVMLAITVVGAAGAVGIDYDTIGMTASHKVRLSRRSAP